MAVLNSAPAVDVRKVMSGKDGALYDDEGNLLAQIESFQSQVNITNQTYQPLGSAQERSSMTSYKVTLTMTEIVIVNNNFSRMLFDGMKNHPLTYGDQVIRQILRCVVVESKEKIRVVFIGGLEVEAEVEY